jgi:Ca2+-binding RTX toxin-like protein
VAVALTFAAMAIPSVASAGTASIGAGIYDPTALYIDNDSSPALLTVTRTRREECSDATDACARDSVYLFRDDNGATAGQGCRQIDSSQVECTYREPQACDPLWQCHVTDLRLELRLGAGADRVLTTVRPWVTVLAGGGADTVTVRNSFNPILHGEDGADRLFVAEDVLAPQIGLLTYVEGGALYGGAGDDVLRGGTFDQTFSGGAGLDRVDYSDRAPDQPVTVDIDGRSDDGGVNDGPLFLRDLVGVDVERVDGSRGNDILSGHEGTDAGDALNGLEGTDELRGGGGRDALSGGPGDDVLVGGPGPDVLTGAAGIDTATYEQVSEPLDVRLDGAANDGGASDGRGDSAAVENVIGGSGNDVLVGDASANLLEGRGGNDALTGGSGPDTLRGGDGTDTVTYAGRTDGLQVSLLDNGPNDGGAQDGAAGARDSVGPDVENLLGGSAADGLIGSPFVNLMRGGPGNDAIDVRGDTVTDTVFCGAGNSDRALITQGDAAQPDCEIVQTG